jgi:hypothetical protein
MQVTKTKDILWNSEFDFKSQSSCFDTFILNSFWYKAMCVYICEWEGGLFKN